MIEILKSGGPIMIPLMALSMVALAIVLERLWVLRRSNYLRDETVSTLSHYLGDRQFKAAVGYCNMNPGPFTNLVAALVENRFAPYDELKEILEDTGRRELMGLQRGLPALGTIVAGAPLLGLLGTVLGMIKIFTSISFSGLGDPHALSGGISQAMITTAIGLVIGIPTLVAYNLLAAKSDALEAEIEARATQLVTKLRGNSTEAIA